MVSLLLAVIYAAFISLGLPDALLGSAWPIMHTQMNVPLSYAGIVTFTIAMGTVNTGVDLRSGPGTEHEVLATVPVGRTVSILSEEKRP